MYFSDFLSERKGLFDPTDERIQELTKIEKIDFSEGNLHLGKYKPSKTKQIIVEPNDFVFSGLNIEKGAVSLNFTGLRLVVSANYSTCKINFNVIDKEFLYYLIRSQYFKSILIDHLKKDYGFTRPKHLMPLSFFAPSSMEDQRQIIEQLKRTEIEGLKLKSELINQQNLLKKLRQQILQDAIEGKLTADWRAQNPDVEPASELLKRITAEKAQLVKGKKIKAQKPFPPIADEEKPFELPKEWEWCRLGDLAISYEAGTSFKCADRGVSNNEWGVIKTSAVTSSIFLESENKFYCEKKPTGRLAVISKGDLIFCRASGSKGLAGKCCIVSDISNNLLLSDKTPRLVLSKFVLDKLVFFHNETTHTGIYYASLNTGKSTSMNNVTKDQLLNKPVPLPPLEEQKAIVSKVENLLALCDQLEQQITQNQTHAEQLMQAVLKEAFSQNKAETQKISTVVPFKPKGSDYYKRTLLAAEIVYQLHNEPTLGHLKLQKLIYLCQKSENMQLPVNFLQQAAGPYDPQMARSLDKQLYDKGWFQYQGDGVPKYKPLQKAGEHKLDFQKYFAATQAGIQTIIDLFRKAKSDQMEIVATLYACWEKIIESKEPFSNELLIQTFYAWSEEKSKFPEERLTKAVAWMQEKNIVPDVNRERN